MSLREAASVVFGLAAVLPILLFVYLLSSANLSWEIQVFGSHDGASADPNVDTFLGRWTFATGDAILFHGKIGGILSRLLCVHYFQLT